MDIAVRKLLLCQSTLSRELKRNSTPSGKYIWFKAHAKAMERRKRSTRNAALAPELVWRIKQLIITMVVSEKVCKILLRPSPPAWGTPSRRGICDVDVSLSFYLIFHSRKYGSRLAYVPSVFSLATDPKR